MKALIINFALLTAYAFASVDESMCWNREGLYGQKGGIVKAKCEPGFKEEPWTTPGTTKLCIVATCKEGTKEKGVNCEADCPAGMNGKYSGCYDAKKYHIQDGLPTHLNPDVEDCKPDIPASDYPMGQCKR